MKKIFLFLMMTLLVVPLFAQTTEMLSKKEFQDEKRKLNDNIESAKRAAAEAKKLIQKQELVNDTLKTLLRVEQSLARENADSLEAANVKIRDLQDRIDQTKVNSRNYVIITLVVFGILFIIVFILLFLFKSRHDKKAALLEKENADLKTAVAGLKAENQSLKENLRAASAELSQMLSGGIDQLDKKQVAVKHELTEKLDNVQAKLNEANQLLYDVKAETERKFKENEDKLGKMKKSSDVKSGELEKLIASSTEKQKTAATALSEELKNLKGALEKEIGKVKEGLTAHRHEKQ